ncbi:unnamed protein product [Parascedosporium putredinis]|uniref:Uncharacterized protein n=1 Tax=Parascedosporium putredinis TaxID=1442378 RepID=A0A9P1GXF4_9PEZI|nr:unnamed protein product [Parascedosporium putredinis]CAI7989638.1 unnamed protein product [Parascedosporium putredinis]
MLPRLIARVLFLELYIQYACAQSIRSIFLFKDVMKSNTTALKTSGFNTLIMFGVGILDNGDIKYYSNTPGSEDVVIASGGEYVGGDALAEKVRSFKEGETGVDRLEISMNSQHVQDLMTSPVPLSSTCHGGLWKDVGEMGYKYTIAPYTNGNFWVSVTSQLNSGLQEADFLVDRVYLQCYDGGANNDPGNWQSGLGIKVVPLLWVVNDSKPVYGVTASQAQSRFAGWHQRSPLGGGGYWNDYDIEKMGLSYADYGKVLTTVFP